MAMFACLKRVSFQEVEKCVKSADYAKGYIYGIQPDTEILNLKQSWDGLHFLLSPDRRKPANVWDTAVVWDNLDLMGMSIIGKEPLNKNLKFGFGTPKWLAPQQVQEIAKELKELEWEHLEDSYNPEMMHQCGVYPEELWDDEDKGRKYLKYWFSQLTRFYDRAAASGQAIVFFMKV